MTLPPITCLVVDDLQQNLVALEALLRRDGVEVLTARSGVEALELLLKHDIALALIDVQMPDMDGFELAETMRGSERTRRVPIVFVTAATQEPWRVFKGYHAGAVDFLYKPVDPLILESKAAVFFELHRQRQLVAEELRQRTETLRLQEMFTGVLGHDLRNPLNAMLTGAVVLQGRPDDATVREVAQRILTSGRRMSRLIDDLLDLTRARMAGGLPLTCAAMDLAAVAERVVQELGATHPTRAITLRIDGDVCGAWDADRLQQALSNLVANALEHGDPAGPIGVVVTSDESKIVTATVTNPGAIDPDLLPTIFDPFQSGRRHRGPGLGLGLYIARQVALAHGGDLSVRSAPEEGTAFVLTLPRVAETVASR